MGTQIKRLFVTSWVAAAFFSVAVFGFTAPGIIKVGLEGKYQNLGSVTVLNQSVMVGYRSEGEHIDFGVLNTSGGLSARASDGYFVEIGSEYTSFADVSERAEAYRGFGYNAGIAFKDRGFSIYAGPYSKAEAEAAADDLSGSVIAPGERVILSNGNSLAAILDSPEVVLSDSAGGVVDLGERKYRGGIGFIVSGQTLTAVNFLTIEEYLYSVVPSEMPSSWHQEALKAQAVAARSYSLTRASAHSDSGYNFCDKAHCQSYLGAGNEAEAAVAAVNATAGVLAYYDGEPINAVYFSSSGGYTEDSEKTWSAVVPYLRAVPDTYEVSGMQWQRSFTLSEIQSLLTDDIGSVTGVYVGKVSPSGRVQELVIQGTAGSKTLVKEGIRTFFLSSEEGMLESRNFVMEGASTESAPTILTVAGVSGSGESSLDELYAVSSTGETIKLSSVSAVGKDSSASYQASDNVVTGGSSQGERAVFTGRGWGHGVGMSQYGAKDMAEAGYNYVEILQHYYSGIEVK